LFWLQKNAEDLALVFWGMYIFVHIQAQIGNFRPLNSTMITMVSPKPALHELEKSRRRARLQQRIFLRIPTLQGWRVRFQLLDVAFNHHGFCCNQKRRPQRRGSKKWTRKSSVGNIENDNRLTGMSSFPNPKFLVVELSFMPSLLKDLSPCEF